MISKNLEEAKADIKMGLKEAREHAEALFGGKGLTDPIPTVEVSHDCHEENCATKTQTAPGSNNIHTDTIRPLPVSIGIG